MNKLREQFKIEKDRNRELMEQLLNIEKDERKLHEKMQIKQHKLKFICEKINEKNKEM